MKYNFKDETYTGELEGIELIIKAQIDALPRWCKGLEGDFESHDWLPTYGRYTPYPNGGLGITHTPNSDPTRMFPYYLCRHCHAVSNNFTEPHRSIKRVR